MAAAHVKTIREAVTTDLQCVTYSWLANNLAISAAEAKDALFAFVKSGSSDKGNSRGDSVPVKGPDGVGVTYFISGITAGGDVEVKVVPASRLDAARAKLAKVTTMHIYSVHPAAEVDDTAAWPTEPRALSSRLWAADYAQRRVLALEHVGRHFLAFVFCAVAFLPSHSIPSHLISSHLVRSDRFVLISPVPRAPFNSPPPFAQRATRVTPSAPTRARD